MPPAPLTYGSLFSGIGAASVAWRSLGWKCKWFAEVDDFCDRVLHHHWPGVPNLGDVTADDFIERACKVDVVVGGSPCQSWSQAGLRGGLDDPRGRLTHRYFEIIEALRPRWWIWENVPGVMSHEQAWSDIQRRATAAGYDISHRTLTASDFGLLHSRTRLFVVGHLGNRSIDALFAPGERGPAASGDQPRPSPGRAGVGKTPCSGIAIRTREEGVVAEFSDVAHCLTGGVRIGANFVWDGQQIREYTPVERERLLGFPDDWTAVPGATTADRIRVTGNTMAVPVIGSIGRGIDRAEKREELSPLHNLELRLLRLMPAVNCRPTLTSAIEAGEILAAVKEMLPHGDYLPFLARVGITKQSASDYINCFRSADRLKGTAAVPLTIKGFLEYVRKSKYLARLEERAERVADHLAERGRLPPAVRIVQADAREYDWSEVLLSGVVTDPPWDRHDLYSWLASWAVERIRPGGWVMVMCRTGDIPKVAGIMQGAGLAYVWTLSINFNYGTECRRADGFRPLWRPVLLFAVPPVEVPSEPFTDAWNVKQTTATELHDWQQPLDPFVFWVGKLFAPGSTVADPFSGSGTTAEACLRNGLGFVGTEIDTRTFQLARGRLVKVRKELVMTANAKSS